MNPKNTFTAIDFETAQGARHSICQVGLVRVVNGEIIQTKNILVKPPNNYYFEINIDIHGITPRMTAKAPTFNKIWKEIEPFISNQNVVAHNGAFDFNCLARTLEHYNIKMPDFTKHCTYKIFGEALHICCRKYKIQLNHHEALSDAMACAKLFLIHLSNNK